MTDVEKLSEIVVSILTGDKYVQDQGESLLKGLRESQFNTYILTFTNLLHTSPNKPVRMFCIFHLRRLLSRYFKPGEPSQWDKLPNDSQDHIKRSLIELLEKEQDTVERMLLCELIGELYATINYLKETQFFHIGAGSTKWDDLIPNIWSFFPSGKPELIQCALKILAILFIQRDASLFMHQNELLPVIKQGLEHNDLRVKACAVETLSTYIQKAATKNCLACRELILPLLNAITVTLNQNEDLGSDVLNNVLLMVEGESKIFKPYFKEFLDTIKAIHLQNFTIDSIKPVALEITVMSFEYLPQLAKNNPIVIKDFFECCFAYLAANAENTNQDWLYPSEDSMEKASPYQLAIKNGMSFIDRVVNKLGGQYTLEVFSQILVQLVQMNKWQYTYAALMGLSQAGEYITEINEYDHIVGFTLHFLKDEHPKVRFAALECIGQFAASSRLDFQGTYLHKVLPALIEVLEDPIPRIVSHCLAALDNFLDNCKKGSASDYIEQILKLCLHSCSASSAFVRQDSIVVISTVANKCQKDFILYWEQTLETVLNVLREMTDKKYKKVQGVALECISFVGQAIGKEEFKKVADQVIEILIDIQKNHLEEVDILTNYVFAVWQRLCLVLQDDLNPYLGYIMPSLFALIERVSLRYNTHQETDEKIEVLKALGEAQQEDTIDEAKKNLMEEVLNSVKMITVFANQLKKEFLPYVEKTSTLFTNYMKTAVDAQVQTRAAVNLHILIQVIQERSDPNKSDIIRILSNNYIDILWKIINENSDPEERLKFVYALRLIIKSSGTFMDTNEVQTFSNNILASLKKSDQNMLENERLVEDEDVEIDELEQEAVLAENVDEYEFQCAIAELIGILLKTHQELALPLAETIYTSILPQLIHNSLPWNAIKVAIFLIDNLLEFLNYESLQNKWQTLGQILIKYSTHEKAELRHTAVFGIGLLAQKAKEHYQRIDETSMNDLFSSLELSEKENKEARLKIFNANNNLGEINFENFAEASLKALFAALQAPKTNEDDMKVFHHAKDNVVAAIGKIIKYQPQSVNIKQLTSVWLKHLPLKYDKKEAKEQHDFLLDIILEKDASLIFGENGENMFHVVRIFALVLNNSFCLKNFKEKVKRVIEALIANPEAKFLLQEGFSKLEPDLLKTLKNCLE